jgi:CHAT domain-containing protein
VLADPVFETDDPRVKSQEEQTRNSKSEIPNKFETQNPKSETHPPSALRPPPFADEALSRSARQLGLNGFRRLESSRREAEALIALVPSERSFKAVDFAACKSTALSGALGQFRIVHFATHGLLNSRRPELSGLVLSLVNEQGEPQDGFLRLHDVYNLELAADVVVLSACRTALGKEIRGEGLVGLTRGFMYAGAPRVVASVWEVSDVATARLMRRFYEGMLRTGLPPAAALRAAQLSLWREKRWQPPYYWAGFIFQGEWK